MIYFCCEDERRELIRNADQPLNGIDYLEVVDAEFDAANQDKRQRFLRVFFVKEPVDAAPHQMRTALEGKQFQVRLTGGERVTAIKVKSASFKVATAAPATPVREAHIEIELSERGDFSTYTLSLREPSGDAPLAGLDPRLASVDFSFKVECPSDLDCREVCACPPPARVEPELDYLAKDYQSFRQLLLDRLSLIAPEWRERNPADLGVMLVELMAYVGDYLSYRQDAIATEAYPGTARQRVSLRRHARLLDYTMHEGCNARAWVQVLLNEAAPDSGVTLPANDSFSKEVEDPQKLVTGTCFSTAVGPDIVLAKDADELKRVLDAGGAEVFEPLHEVFLHKKHNEMPFYTWAGSQCCLPKGAVKATLAGSFPLLKDGDKPGAVLIFIEQRGPRTGGTADADLNKRHAVRLTKVSVGTDTLTNAEITEIEWAEEDALPFPLCLSSVDEHGNAVPGVSVALGNIVLADHGRTLPEAEFLNKVPKPIAALSPVAAQACGHCAEETPDETAARFYPRLGRVGVTHSQAAPKISEAVADALIQEPREALPAIRLFEELKTPWKPERDLIGSGPTAPRFVGAIENDGRAHIRFGDDVHGMRPGEDQRFHARYRIGNGARGNIGAHALTRIFAPQFLDPATRLPVAAASDMVKSVTNPMPARGGTDAEPMEDVRQYAPEAFKTPRRCVTPSDYARRAGEHPGVQRAAATVRWTGSWHTIFLSVDRRGGKPVDDLFETKLLEWLEPWRMAGHDLEIDRPRFASLELTLFVCVAPGYFRSDVKAALLDVFSARTRPDGSRGFFHPDNVTFGDPVHVSAIVAAAQRIPGVRHVEVLRLRRQGATTDPLVPKEGALTTSRLEIVRLENDRNFPDRGELKLELKGGQ